MTGGEAKITPKVNATFTAWDGYIEGKNLELQSGKYIKQSWRTSEFKEGQEDSIVEITLFYVQFAFPGCLPGRVLVIIPWGIQQAKM